ncbi:MAG: hypothetical protein MZU95_09655 [Desulfomicrobium escambiense]|nr:hypothetical protein [Desulfomicrobium escambiense]
MRFKPVSLILPCQYSETLRHSTPQDSGSPRRAPTTCVRIVVTLDGAGREGYAGRQRISSHACPRRP